MQHKALASIRESVKKVTLPPLEQWRSKQGAEAVCRKLARLAVRWGNRVCDVRRTGLVRGNVKADQSIVTDFDKTIEASFRQLLARHYGPAITVVAEEEQNIFRAQDIRSLVAIMDPIDGTSNFYRDGSNFAVSLCIIDNGVPFLVIIYNPAIGQGVATTVFSAGKNLMPHWLDNIQERPDFWKSGQQFIVGTELRNKDMVFELELLSKVIQTLVHATGGKVKLRTRGTSALNALSVSTGGIDLYYQPAGMGHDLIPPACAAFFAGLEVRTCDGQSFFPLTAEKIQAGLRDDLGIVIGSEPFAAIVAGMMSR